MSVKAALSALSLLAAATRLLGVILVVGSLGGGATALLVRAGGGGLGSFRGSGSRSVRLALATTSSLLGGLGGGVLLELLSNGSLDVGRGVALGGVLEVRHGDLKVLGVLEGLLVAHVLGIDVTSLV